jgi:hypothetical protein
MVTPAKGDVVSIPLKPEGLRVAEAWDPAKDEAAGEQCRAYGCRRSDARSDAAARHVAGRQHAED